MSDADAVVFDTGPLRHFTLRGWLGVLKFLTNGRAVLIPETVEDELKRQSHGEPVLQQVLQADWITVDRSTDIAFLAAFARYENRLVVDGNNVGECGVLALGSTCGYELVLDDATPRRIAQDEGLRVTATLPLLCEAIRAKQLTVPLVEALADDLIIGTYYLPFQPGEFRRWALEHGLLDYDEI
ncbi:nucleotide-binding protein [Promicromonospora sp. Populi]|uniref:nucleotide-binding protein n=1 Tax=Promicromonospora sp. Populi TaxID=3239420 RepID=UPI0034E1E96F